jgi:hypothetical protein
MEGRFVPGYAAPASGLAAWVQPEAASPPTAHIDARVELQLVERYGDWAHIECSNGWRAWVDSRLLAPVTLATAAQPRSRSALNPAITTVGRYTITLADLIPAVGVVLGALLPWLRGGVGRSNAFNVPLAFLVNTSTHKTHLTLGALLALAALIAAAAPSRVLRLAAYAAALAGLVGYLLQLNRLLHQAQSGLGIGSVLGIGVYVGIAAACLGLVWTAGSARSARR